MNSSSVNPPAINARMLSATSVIGFLTARLMPRLKRQNAHAPTFNSPTGVFICWRGVFELLLSTSPNPAKDRDFFLSNETFCNGLKAL